MVVILFYFCYDHNDHTSHPGFKAMVLDGASLCFNLIFKGYADHVVRSPMPVYEFLQADILHKVIRL